MRTIVELREVIDTWNVIEKFNITDYECINSTVRINESDYNKILDGSVNKAYIKGLRK